MKWFDCYVFACIHYYSTGAWNFLKTCHKLTYIASILLIFNFTQLLTRPLFLTTSRELNEVWVYFFLHLKDIILEVSEKWFWIPKIYYKWSYIASITHFYFYGITNRTLVPHHISRTKWGMSVIFFCIWKTLV